MTRALVLTILLVSCTDEPPARSWQVVLEGLDTGLISVWGTSADDVWAVGGDDGNGPLVLHYDGTDWERIDPGVRGLNLWWVTGTGASDPMYFGGDGGTILRYEAGAFVPMAVPDRSRTVFGIFAASPTEAWAVGGSGGIAGFVWRWDGARWTDVPLPAGVAERAVFKAWGSAPDDVWFVGAGGVLMHWDGSALLSVASGTMRTILTVHTLGERAAAVGGTGSGLVIERDPETSAWRDVTPELSPGLLGIWLTAEGGWAVGENGRVLRRVSSGWVFDDAAPPVVGVLHSCWVDPDGGLWAVGGILSGSFSDGVLVYHGPLAINEWNQ